jgi:hypothetical protein
MTRKPPAALYKKRSPARRELFGFTSVPPSNETRRTIAGRRHGATD